MGLTTATSTGSPTGCAGVRNRISDALTKRVSGAGAPAITAVHPGSKADPRTVTSVPPEVTPEAGSTPSMRGGAAKRTPRARVARCPSGFSTETSASPGSRFLLTASSRPACAHDEGTSASPILTEQPGAKSAPRMVSTPPPSAERHRGSTPTMLGAGS